MKIAVLMTCFNRKDITLKAVQSIKDSVLREGTEMDLVLLDDNSKDGSAEAAKELFPNIHIVKGNGQLYWNRGMFMAWMYAVNKGLYDYFVWFNDDTVIRPFSIQKMLDWSKERGDNAMIGGFLVGNKDREISYGGLGRRGETLLPNGSLQIANELNGNFVVIPFRIYEKVGVLDLDYPHAIGDFDYSHRVLMAGFELLLSPEIMGVCDKNTCNPDWCNRKIRLSSRLKALYTPKAYSHPYYQFKFEKNYRGLGIAIFHFMTIHLRALFPSFWKGNGF